MAAGRTSEAWAITSQVGLFVGFFATLVIVAVALSDGTELPAPAYEVAKSAAQHVTVPPVVAAADDDELPTDLINVAQNVAPAAATLPATPTPDVQAIESTPTVERGEPAKNEPYGRITFQPVGRLPALKWTPEQLQTSLLNIPEIWLQNPAIPTIPKTGRAGGHVHPVLSVIEARPDLKGLQVRRGVAAQLPTAEADAFRDASVLYRKALGGLTGQEPKNKRLQFHNEVLTAQPQISARVLNQMLQVESIPLRKSLVSHLKPVRGREAGQAIARRAVYEPTAEIRLAAIKALAARPTSDYLPTLVEAIGSPWPPAADLAAEAITALAVSEAVPDLIRCLDEPQPGEPPSSIAELVRVNHNRNCLLCHAQSVSRNDGVRVAVPNPLQPLPPPFSLDTYEGGGRGGSTTPRGTVFVRPDITYLQQDFSWMLPVANSGYWPTLQRYDFVVRQRAAAAGESSVFSGQSPQRRAVLRTLQSLTGKDFGDRAEDWRAGLGLAAKGE